MRKHALVFLVLVAACGDAATSGSPADGGFGSINKDDGGGDQDGDVTIDDSGTGTDASQPKDAGADTKDAFVWPDCASKPASAAQKTISEIWTANYATPTETWITGAYVTAVSKSGCTANQACQIFLQTDPTYASLAAGAHKGIKLFASAATASHFTGIAVGDKVDVLGYAWRYTLDGQNELLVEVNLQLPGCAKKTGTGTPAPITGVSLSDLTVASYEQTYGPLLVQVANVSGTPSTTATETFGLYPTGGNFDAGGDFVSLSPFFMSGGAFAFVGPAKKNFTSVTGVFGLFVPAVDAGTPTKYVEIYARSSADLAP